MRVLWIVNTILPEASLLMDEPVNPFSGWLVTSSIDLSLHEEIDLTIAFPLSSTEDIDIETGKSITYIAFPALNDNNANQIIEKMIESASPDLIHIHGTEYNHSFYVARFAKERQIPFVISIQGLVSVYQHHFLSGVPSHVASRMMLRDFIKKHTLLDEQKTYAKRGAFEEKAISLASHIIGRTAWDYTCIKQMNPKAKYHHVNESLRKSFYEHQWDIKQKTPYSIFLSQGLLPAKGLHFLLRALPLVMRRYPDTHLYIGGENIFTHLSLVKKLKQTSYSAYIQSLINQYGLASSVTFLGIMQEEDVVKQLLSTHVAVNCSSIENSPNSVAEAMILGVPLIASFVGGVPSMVANSEEGLLYPHDSVELLAQSIISLFENDELCLQISSGARKKGLVTHDVALNTQSLIGSYQNILKN